MYILTLNYWLLLFWSLYLELVLAARRMQTDSRTWHYQAPRSSPRSFSQPLPLRSTRACGTKMGQSSVLQWNIIHEIVWLVATDHTREIIAIKADVNDIIWREFIIQTCKLMLISYYLLCFIMFSLFFLMLIYLCVYVCVCLWFVVVWLAYLLLHSNSQERQKYTVLLIITDGIINDIDATIASIVTASSQPLSIIIVGVGNEDFSSTWHCFTLHYTTLHWIVLNWFGFKRVPLSRRF